MKQEPMFTDADPDLDALPDSEYNYEWNIKLDYITSKDNAAKGWLNISEES